MIDVEMGQGSAIPLIDSGAFDWLRKLCSNNKLTFVASGLGSRLIATCCNPVEGCQCDDVRVTPRSSALRNKRDLRPLR